MYVHIQFSWRPSYRPLGWSFGYCDSCQHAGPIRHEKVVEVLYLNEIIPVRKRHKGQATRCDFCRRLLVNVVPDCVAQAWDVIALDDWSPQEGLAALCKKLGISTPVDHGNASTDARLHSLLSAAQQTFSLSKIELSPVGVLGGGILGVLAAIPLATWLHQNQLAPARMDELGFAMILCGIGAVLGVVVGALIEVLLRRNRGVRARIREAYYDYPFDLYRLEQLSQEYGKNLQKAVKTLIDEVPRNW